MNKDNLVKFECYDCGCYFWVENRNIFNCPNCKEKVIEFNKEQLKIIWSALMDYEEKHYKDKSQKWQESINALIKRVQDER